MKKIPFRIVGIEAERFFLKEQATVEGSVDVRTDFGFAVNAKEKLVKSKVFYTYSQAGENFLELTLSCVFAIEPSAFEEMMRDGKFVIEPFFSQYLATINVGAARGEIHARCEVAGNKKMAQVILPPINLVDALPENIVIDL